jgi:hypothetical protein
MKKRLHCCWYRGKNAPFFLNYWEGERSWLTFFIFGADGYGWNDTGRAGGKNS